MLDKDILQCEGYAGERAERVAGAAQGVDAGSAGERPVGVDVQERVELAVDGADAVEVGLGDLDGRDLARGDGLTPYGRRSTW